MQQRREQDSQRAASVVFVRCIIYINKCIGNNREAKKKNSIPFCPLSVRCVRLGSISGWFDLFARTHTLIVFASMTT